MSQMSWHTSIAASTIKSIILEKLINKRNPNYRRYRVIRDVLNQKMERSRTFNITTLKLYAYLVCKLDHNFEIYTMDGTEINKVWMKATQFIFRQCQKDCAISKYEQFYPVVVYLIYICDKSRYYSGVFHANYKRTHYWNWKNYQHSWCSKLSGNRPSVIRHDF